MSILGGSGGKKKANSVGMGGGPSLANSAGKAAGSGIKSLWDSIFNKPVDPNAPYAATQPGGLQGPESPFGNDLNLPPGASSDQSGNGQIDWSNYGYPGDYGGSNTGLSDYLNNMPSDFTMGDVGTGGGGDYGGASDVQF
jgi:hypothetical protein